MYKRQAQHIFGAGTASVNVLEDEFRLRHLPGSGIPACQPSAGRIYDFHTVLSQRFQVVLGHRILIHCRIHRRHDDLRTSAGQEGSRQHVISHAMSNLGNHIGGCRGDYGNVRLLGKSNMFDMERCV